MALSIIRSGARASLPDDIQLTEEVDHDEYRGPLKSLLDAGIVRVDQLPPPGKVSIGYFQGQVISRKCKRDETYLRVSVYDPENNTVVLVGVSHEVAAARRIAATEARAKAQAERQELARKLETMRDPGIEAARKELQDSPARFKVGDLCMHVDGRYMEIVKGYELRHVWCEDGRYLHEESGQAFSYIYGYTARELGESPFFYPAHHLLDADGRVKHLQLVR
ncbi:hypothetical protein ACIPRI_14655 [Variovorax sp. LARHSF232]